MAIECTSWHQVDALVGEMRRIDARVAKIVAKRERRKALIDERYREALDDEGKVRKATAAAVRKFCTKHRRDLGDAKSRQLDNGVIAWKLGNHSVGLLSKAKSWAVALVKVVANAPEYVRIIREIWKAKLIEDYKAGKLTDEQLAAWDLRIIQVERLHIEPKLDEPRDRSEEG